jgi:hypothetical protein
MELELELIDKQRLIWEMVPTERTPLELELELELLNSQQLPSVARANWSSLSLK